MLKLAIQGIGVVMFVLMLGDICADGVTDVTINPTTGLTISTPGSYRLTSNVTLTGNVKAVNITAANVTLDLNGHTITAPAVSTQYGIESTATDVNVLNGTIIGFGQSGIRLNGAGATVRNVMVSACNKSGGYQGIRTGDKSIVEQCRVMDCTPTSSGGTYGIYTGNRCRVEGNIVDNNDSPDATAIGILSGMNSILLDNIVQGNTSNGGSSDSYGLSAGAFSVVGGNTLSDNDHLGTGDCHGINVATACLIQSNVVSNHTTGITGVGTCYGILSGSEGKVIDNACSNNDAGAGSNGSAYGISVGNSSEVRGNSANGHSAQGTGIAAGIQAAANCTVVENNCRTNSGGSASAGIRITSSSNVVAHNNVGGSADAGLLFETSTQNRAHSNQVRQNNVFELTNGVTPSSVGAGDLANVTY